MRLDELEELLKTSGLPVAYRAWKPKSAPSLPYICYLVAFSENFYADGVVYQKVDHVQIELYTKHKDPVAEGRVEKALASFVWDKIETYLDSEQCYQILYEIEV